MLAEPKCHISRCKHFISVDQQDGALLCERGVCRALPNGIPGVIADGNNVHTSPFPRHRGIGHGKEGYVIL